MGGPPPPPPPGKIDAIRQHPITHTIGPGGPPPPPGPPGAPGAPPAPGMAMGGLPAKKNKLTQKAMKPLQWTKLNNMEVPATVWKEIDDEKVHKKMDYTEFETLFGQVQKKAKAETAKVQAVRSSDNVAAEVPKITVLDSKRSQNTSTTVLTSVHHLISRA